MFSIKEKVEVETELAPPDKITMVYRRNKDIKNVPQFINLGKYTYRVVSWDFNLNMVYTCLGERYNELNELEVNLELIHTTGGE